MQDTYGIFTTDGEIVAGYLNDEYAVSLAEMLDESTASLYLSTRNGTLLMGTAVNVQKKGRRPDTVIYLEKSVYDSYLSRIDLSYVQDFYARVRRTLEQNDYEVRNLASDDHFFDERNMQLTSKMSGMDTADYAVGRLLLGKDVLAVSDNLSKSVDFAVLVAGKLKTYMAAGFTIVVAKRTFRDADLMIVDKVSGGYQINLATETVTPGFVSDAYRHVGVFAQKPDVMQSFSGREPLNRISERLVNDFERTQNISPMGRRQFAEFLNTERIRESYSAPQRSFSPESYSESSRRQDVKFDQAGYNSKWAVNEYDREKDYEERMERKQKGRRKTLIVVAVLLVLCAAIIGFVLLNHGPVAPVVQNEPENNPIIPPPDETRVDTDNYRIIVSGVSVNTSNVPAGYTPFGSQYDIYLRNEGEPQSINLTLSTNTGALGSQVGTLTLMRLEGADTETDKWSVFAPADKIEPYEVWVTVPYSGTYRLFYMKAAEPAPQSPPVPADNKA